MPNAQASQVLANFGQILRHDMTVYLKNPHDAQGSQHPLRVVGWVSGRFFLTSCPFENGTRLGLQNGRTYNSKSGCCIKLNEKTAWDINREVNLSFDMPTDNRQYSLTGIVRSVNRSKDRETLGIELYEVPEEFKNQVDVIASVAEEAP